MTTFLKIERHADCQEACQQAVGYGVWPEHSCSPLCVWLKNPPPKEWAVKGCNDNDSPWLVCKPCNRVGKCKNEQP